MKKIVSLFTLIVIGLLSSCSSQTVNAMNHSQIKEAGLTLDIARRFYPVETIKQFIDTIHHAGGTFLHLHFSDHENYALESSYLDQSEENAIVKDGTYYNPKTNKPFLTYKQIDDIIYYAKSKNIELVPEVDTPNHMTAIFNLLEIKHGEAYVKNLKSKMNDEEIDITNPESIEVIKTLIAEVIYIFGHASEHFHIGGDEFGYSVETNHEFISYVNTLNQFINEKGKITRIWNDGLIKNNLNQLNKNVEITYWSYDGDAQKSQDIAERRKIRADLPELLENGFKVLNYNSYYLYFVPKGNANITHDSKYATEDVLNNWKLGLWDGKNKENEVKNTKNIIGSSLSIWGERSGSLSSEVIEESTQDLLKAVIQKTNDPKSH
ncbi:family 20 glycosylhydrolase [Actinobacillus equuli]|uniref:N-acetyl-beta-hexosaminidase n=1 Tax=Actinobacillus equuli TaxID=718 RepID=A0AAX3FHQ8_ACTEU|nr:family 20 glycosylhydrolase [Actinobacillus equuli]AIZ79332.1 molecular chaperone TorD [Actinobacillus equuli subsp. equuli]WGE43450.1 family 20 glycosylhydrolase [Actinobacillus equuli subsp. equuli]VEE89738.1 N-acetyl-beta-hexosaminidase [Actinobacillus equuli]